MSPAPPLRLVISDIDGTLLDDSGAMPELNRRALEQCRSRGIATCLATGRRWTTCRRLLERLDLFRLVDYCILNNGMIVQDAKSPAPLYRREFPFALTLQVVGKLHALGLDAIGLGFNPDGLGPDVFHRRDSLLNADFIDKNHGHCRQVSQWSELENTLLLELVLVGRRPDLEKAAAALAGLEVETALIRNTFYAESMLEITPRGVSKFSGAQVLLDHLRVGRHEVLAVGDSDNDFELLKNIPRSVAVANADARIKAVVREIAESNGEAGFGRAVFRHLGLPAA